MRVVFLGTGNAFNTDGRLSQSLWVESPGVAPLLVDIGPTALAAMQRYRLDPGAVERVFLTHLHGDHLAGWPFLLLHDVYIQKRSRPLQVFGPRGTAAQLEMLCFGCYPDLIAQEKLGFPVEFSEIEVASATGLDAGADIRLDVVPLEHHSSSIGYRIHAAGRSVGITGDTGWCSGLEELSNGCDLLILECTSVQRQEYAHVSLEELREGAGRLASKRIALVHLSSEVALALQRDPIPNVFAAEDGMAVEV
jgi:ribonuclease BN (tRNA processing enzyme)